MKKVLTCVGTRPNLIKITQLDRWFQQFSDMEHKLLHTGQHFDYNMNQIFFDELNLKKPDFFLEISGDSSLQVIGAIMSSLENFIKSYRPDLVMVPGDVNSSFACAFAAQRMGIPVAHIESGLRSFDMTMPEEINRILIDALAEMYFVTEESGKSNLLNEGKSVGKIHFVGNSMIDSLVAFLPLIEKSTIRKSLNLADYYLLTFHRPANVDTYDNLLALVNIVFDLSQREKVVFPIHPRTRKRLVEFGLQAKLHHENIVITDPFGYLDFMNLVKYAKVVITDSGGVQEETTYMRVPCITVRNSTERPVTVDEGTNTLAELKSDSIMNLLEQIEKGDYKNGKIPYLWDGLTSKRIVETLKLFFDGRLLEGNN